MSVADVAAFCQSPGIGIHMHFPVFSDDSVLRHSTHARAHTHTAPSYNNCSIVLPKHYFTVFILNILSIQLLTIPFLKVLINLRLEVVSRNAGLV